MAARSGDVDTGARCLLAERGIRHPTPEQVAGALLRAGMAHDVAALRDAYVKEE